MKKSNYSAGLIIGCLVCTSLWTGCLSPNGASSDASDGSALRSSGANPGGIVDVNSEKKGTTKVDVCHIPPGNPANAHTITVGSPAVKAHLDHGDVLGACVDIVSPPCGDCKDHGTHHEPDSGTDDGSVGPVPVPGTGTTTGSGGE